MTLQFLQDEVEHEEGLQALPEDLGAILKRQRRGGGRGAHASGGAPGRGRGGK